MREYMRLEFCVKKSILENENMKEKIKMSIVNVNDKIKVYKNCKIELDNFVYFLIMSLIQ